MREVDVLLLDDFGTEGGMKVDNVVRPVRKDMQDFMYRVANVRIDFDKNKVEKPTIITTNNLQEDIDRMYNQKAVSRLYPKSKEHRIAFNKMGDVRNVD
jgi:DNA replication protein DnaC